MTTILVGKVGRITVATKPNGGLGEVLLRFAGGSETFLARSKTSLPIGTTVLCVDTEPGRIANVIPWDEESTSITKG